jgi:hypothetical protein
MKIKENTLLLVGMEAANIGMTADGHSVYCYNTLVEEVKRQRELDHIEAVSFVDFNIANAYLGEYTPIIVYPISEDDA